MKEFISGAILSQKQGSSVKKGISLRVAVTPRTLFNTQ